MLEKYDKSPVTFNLYKEIVLNLFNLDNDCIFPVTPVSEILIYLAFIKLASTDMSPYTFVLWMEIVSALANGARYFKSPSIPVLYKLT